MKLHQSEPSDLAPAAHKIAIIGFGRLAQGYYAFALRSLSTAEVVAVADSLPASSAAAAAAFPDARTYPDYHDLFERERDRLDAILVASPPSTHLAIWNEAARRRLPVFMEKPFIVPGELERVETSPASRSLLMLNLNRRFWPAYRSLRELCSSGRIGIVERADFTLQTNIQPWISVTRHRLSPGEGGALYDLGSSELDLIEYVFAQKIAGVRAQSETIVWPGDRLRLSVELERGLRVSCELGYARGNRERIEIVGSKATARIENPNAAVHIESRGSRKRPVSDWFSDTLAFGLKALSPGRTVLRYTIRASLAAFFDALSGRQPFSPGFDDAIANANCLEAAVRSIREDKFVEVSAPGNSKYVRQQPA